MPPLRSRIGGKVFLRHDYGAWSETLPGGFDNVPGGMPYGFVGALGVKTDADSGLAYMRQRWYDPLLQRFISRDPIGLRGGPNLYSYVGNSPTNAVDPSGTTFTVNASGAARAVRVGGAAWTALEMAAKTGTIGRVGGVWGMVIGFAVGLALGLSYALGAFGWGPGMESSPPCWPVQV